MSDKDWLEDFESRVWSVRLDLRATCDEIETPKVAVSKLLHAVSLLHQAQICIDEAKGMIGEE